MDVRSFIRVGVNVARTRRGRQTQPRDEGRVLTISTVFLRFFTLPSPPLLATLCVSLIFLFNFPVASSASESRAIGASAVPSSVFSLAFAETDPFEGPADAESAGRGSVAVESAAVTDAEGARMLTFFDFGFRWGAL